jgi:hypothetical protein
MAKTTTTADSELLDFVQKHYNELKAEAEADNTDDTSTQTEIKNVIGLIEILFNTIKKDEVTHQEIVKQLQEIKKQYSNLKLDEPDYTRYKEADENLNTIMTGLKVE